MFCPTFHQALLAGTTALMAIIHGSRLVVANVGDSRGVMCDWRGNAIPLSFDHKPQQVKSLRICRVLVETFTIGFWSDSLYL